jgi:hypothetical protein
MMERDELRRWERNLQRLVNKAGDGDAEQFAAIVALLDRAVNAGLKDAAEKLRQPTTNGSAGYSWGDLGGALGVTRQAAQQRFGKKQIAEPAGGVR